MLHRKITYLVESMIYVKVAEGTNQQVSYKYIYQKVRYLHHMYYTVQYRYIPEGGNTFAYWYHLVQYRQKSTPHKSVRNCRTSMNLL